MDHDLNEKYGNIINQLAAKNKRKSLEIKDDIEIESSSKKPTLNSVTLPFLPSTQSHSNMPDRNTNKTMDQSVLNVTTSNRYAVLDNTNTASAPNTSATNTHSKQKQHKLPPIVTIDLNHTQIKSLMNTAEVNKFYIKYMSIGTKIMFDCIEDYTKAKNILQANKFNFFTHDIPSDKSIKFVLSGLHDLSEQEVKEGLINENINFLDVKKMNSKNISIVKSNRSCLYLVYFSNDSKIKLSDLKAHKYIMNAVVKWAPYINSRNGPTQCNKCQLYGHGNKNCHLSPRCMFCSGVHLSADCPNVGASTSTSTFTPKCCLCAGAHPSNDRSCPKRNEFIRMRIRTSDRLTSSQPQSSKHHPLEFHSSLNSQKEFPPLASINASNSIAMASRWARRHHPQNRIQISQTSFPSKSYCS